MRTQIYTFFNYSPQIKSFSFARQYIFRLIIIHGLLLSLIYCKTFRKSSAFVNEMLILRSFKIIVQKHNGTTTRVHRLY